MSMHEPLEMETSESFMGSYLVVLSLVERLHRRLLDLVKDEFVRLGIIDINAVQALLLFNIGDDEVSVGQLKTLGYYQGANVSYNLKKLIELGYIQQQRSEVDRRTVRVRLTEKGRAMRALLENFFETQVDNILRNKIIEIAEMPELTSSLGRIERYWKNQIRYIY